VVGFIALTIASVVALLAFERVGARAGIWVAKPLAATGFVATGLAAGAASTPYGRWVLAALVLCWLGDVLLIPRGARRAFALGLASFLLGHLAYVGAFASRGLDLAASGLAAIAAGAALWLVLRWLRPHLPAHLRAAVYAYTAVISVMLICAVGTGETAIRLGALMFYVSDLAVARERFVAPSFWNKAWGLPLYFGGQLVLASSVG
jgi:uncharacterized membrane protein YhhN